MINKQIAVGIGEILWDILPEGKKLGGAPANFAYHATQFGLEGVVVSAVGNDDAGQEILNLLSARNIGREIAILPYPTGTVEIELDPNGIPQYAIKENVAWDYIPLSPNMKAIASRTKVVCFGSLAQRTSLSRQTITAFLDEVARNEDSIIVFDINLRQSFYDTETIESSMQRCNILKLNNEELDVICPLLHINSTSPEEACQELIERYGLKMLILTCGTSGSYVFSSDEMSYQPTPTVEIADTVGAGDSFTAAFIAAIVKGSLIGEAHSIAVKTSAFVCTQKGAMPELPTDLID